METFGSEVLRPQSLLPKSSGWTPSQSYSQVHTGLDSQGCADRTVGGVGAEQVCFTEPALSTSQFEPIRSGWYKRSSVFAFADQEPADEFPGIPILQLGDQMALTRFRQNGQFAGSPVGSNRNTPSPLLGKGSSGRLLLVKRAGSGTPAVASATDGTLASTIGSFVPGGVSVGWVQAG